MLFNMTNMYKIMRINIFYFPGQLEDVFPVDRYVEENKIAVEINEPMISIIIKPHMLRDVMKYIRDEYPIISEQFNYMRKLDDRKIIRSLNYYMTYDANDANNINNYLRNQTKPKNDKMKQYISNIDKLFRDIPPLREDIIVFRATRVPKISQYSNYVSTTYCYNICENFGEYKVRILIPKGTHVIPVFALEFNRSVHNYLRTNYYHEKEILLPRNGILEFSPNESKDSISRAVYIPDIKFYTPKLGAEDLDEDEKQGLTDLLHTGTVETNIQPIKVSKSSGDS